MSEDAAIRRANLKALCKKRGWSAKELHDAMGGVYSYWRDLLEDPAKSFGEKIARRIEAQLELGRGWLDEDQSAALRRYPVASERIPPHEPQLPSPDFQDRREVSASDWALLQDVKTGATAEELDAIRNRAAIIQRKVEEMMAERIKSATKEQPAKKGR